jgi:hypothetical protein
MEFNPKFTKGVSALTYWYEHGDDAREYSLPAVFLDENEVATTPPPQVFDYPDWWYVWVDLDKLVQKLGTRDKALILSYFLNIYRNERGAFHRWRQKEDFKKMCYRFFLMLPEDYQGSVKINVNKMLISLRESTQKGDVKLEHIDPEFFYTPQEIAYILRYSEKTIRKILKEGKLKGLQLREGGEWRVLGRHLLEFINQPIKENTDEKS